MLKVMNLVRRINHVDLSALIFMKKQLIKY